MRRPGFGLNDFMGKRESAAVLALAISATAGTASADPRLSERESRWIQAAAPVVSYARAQGLPLDIVVQPQPSPGLAPVAMGLVDGRCKLVFSMRGNPEADATEASIPEDLFVPIAEAVAAHEMAHCWRRVVGAWSTVPAGYADPVDPGDSASPELKARWAAMRETRREEGFADLVGLAWIHTQHPTRYARVHAWFSQERADPPVPGSHHDTRAWLRLAGRPGAFTPGPTPFDQALGLWADGLAQAD